MSTPEAKQDAWNRHWKAGHLSSLSTANQTTEAPEAFAAWEAFFGYINSDAIILDVATGNGIVPALAQAHAKQHGKKLEVVAIDKADIDPEVTLGENAEAVKGTLFIGGVEAEDLPFEDDWFDAITGQYALEYTFTDRSIPEISRVLKKEGIIRLVCHARDGVIVKFNAPKAGQAKYLLKESGVFEALLKAVEDGFKGAITAEENRAVLKEKTEAAAAHIKTMGENPELEQFLGSLVEAYIGRDQFGGFVKFQAWVGSIKEELEGQVLMMEALDKAALDEAGLTALAEKLAQAGFGSLSLGTLTVGPNQDLLAYTIEGMKT